MKAITFLSAIALLSASAFGGGHLNTLNGQAVKYKTLSPISYRIDMGPLGQFADTSAQRLIVESFQVWANVSTAVIAFTRGADLPVDVDETNYATYYQVYNDGINPIIFDHDGGLIQALFGVEASNSVLGFAGSTYFTGGPDAGFYAEGHAVLNGKFAGTTFTFDQFRATVIHELGHFIGLDHAQINAQYANNGNASDDNYIPTMYPTSVDDDVALGSLHVDDILAVSRLYPESGFLAGTGTISGTVTRADGSTVKGANVIAISTTDSLAYQVSTVTDYFSQLTGDYSVTGLAPGSYWIKIEPIRSGFIEGSSVGPYANSATDSSFFRPVSAEFYNGASESADPTTDVPTSKTSITVAAGGTQTANLVANNPGNFGTSTEIWYHGTQQYTLELPSIYADSRYAVRFTPEISGSITKTAIQLHAGPESIEGSGNLKVTVHHDSLGSRGNIPGAPYAGNVTVPFSSLVPSAVNEIDLQSLNVQVSPGVEFHIVFEVLGAAGDTLQFDGDNGAIETSRSSSYFQPPSSPLGWYNFKDELNYNEGFNLFVTAYLSPATGVGQDPITLYPSRIGLGQNYPNPFNPSTNLPFVLPEEGSATLSVYDILGRQVRTVFADKQFGAGEHTALFDATGLESGAYVAVLRVNGVSTARRILLVK